MTDLRGLFDADERLQRFSAAGDPLERLAAVVDFELFRSKLDAAPGRSDRAKGGRPPYDAVLMFKILVLQVLYGLSDDQAEFQILDRRSFGRFLGLDDAVPMPRRSGCSGNSCHCRSDHPQKCRWKFPQVARRV
jgi:hypothetical protein